MRPTFNLTETPGGTRDALQDSESESSDASFTTAPEQDKSSDYDSSPALQRRRSALVYTGISTATPPDPILSISSRRAIGSNSNMADRPGGVEWRTGSNDAANKQDTLLERNRCKDRSNQNFENDGAFHLLNPVESSIHNIEKHHHHAIFSPNEPSSRLCQASEETVDESLTRAFHSTTANDLPHNDATVMDEDAASYYSSNEWWGGDDSDGDASAVEGLGDVEYSFSDVDLSDGDARDENSVEVDYPTDEDDWTGPKFEVESLDDVDESSESSDTDGMDSGEEDTIAPPLPQPLRPVTTTLPVVVPNEAFSEQRKKRNPWRTLERYYPRQEKTTVASSCFPIHRLPVELLCMVANGLPSESAASLALSSKRTYMALGSKYFKFSDKSSLWKFLLLIEPERQASFACCVCLQLHRPSINQSTGVSKCTKLWQKREGTRFPASITSGLVKMIGRKHLENPRACQGYLSWAAQSTKTTTRHIKVAQHVTPRMIDGNLLIKTEAYVHPFCNGRLTHRSFYEFFRLLEHSWHTKEKVYDICAHRSWATEIGITKELRKYVNDALANKCKRRCSTGFHYRRCYGNDVVYGKLRSGLLPPMIECLLNSQSFKLSSAKISAGEKVHSCNQCATSYSITVRDVAGVGRCMVFTTWKDLGGVRPGEAAKWDAFFTSKTPLDALIPRTKAWMRLSTVPRAYLTYQNVEVQYSIFRTIGTVYQYLPEPDRKIVRDLTRRPERRHFPDDDGQYPTTASDANTDRGSESEEDDSSFSSRLFWGI